MLDGETGSAGWICAGLLAVFLEVHPPTSQYQGSDRRLKVKIRPRLTHEAIQGEVSQGRQMCLRAPGTRLWCGCICVESFDCPQPTHSFSLPLWGGKKPHHVQTPEKNQATQASASTPRRKDAPLRSMSSERRCVVHGDRPDSLFACPLEDAIARPPGQGLGRKGTLHQFATTCSWTFSGQGSKTALLCGARHVGQIRRPRTTDSVNPGGVVKLAWDVLKGAAGGRTRWRYHGWKARCWLFTIEEATVLCVGGGVLGNLKNGEVGQHDGREQSS